jgi:hypothetical protein
MRPLVYICPATGLNVQAMLDQDLIGPDTMHVPLDCPVCNGTHMINLAECKNPDDDKEPNG